MGKKRAESQRVLSKLRELGVSLNANDNLYEQFGEILQDELKKQDLVPMLLMDEMWLTQQVEDACEHLLEALLIDTFDDHNTEKTAHRMAKMFVNEVFAGRYDPKPAITDFPNAKSIDQIHTVGPITVRSTCSHHFVPFVGQAWVGILPGEDSRLLGLSKFIRLANWVFARPQIQEEATEMLTNTIEECFGPIDKPRAIGVVVRAEHLCATWRGAKECGTTMTTSAMRGVFHDDGVARAEFFNLIKGQGF